MKHICYYYHHINAIGGVEIAILNLIEQLHQHYQITVAYSAADSDIDMLIRMSQYAGIVNLNHKQVECDTVIYCSLYCHKDNIKATRSLRWVHGCLTDMKAKLPKEVIDDYISVGRVCKEQLDQQTPKPSTLIYNELNKNIHQLVKRQIKPYNLSKLNLVTVSRISREKGFERMLIISERIKAAGLDFDWHIVGSGYDERYENSIQKLAPDNWIFYGRLENPFPYIKAADLLVQLSDYEAFGYVLLEALVLGTTVLTTDYSSAPEMINESNGYIIRKDLTDFDPEIHLKSKRFNHTHKSGIEQWKNLL